MASTPPDAAPSALRDAIRARDVAEVTRLLDADPSLRSRTGPGRESLVLHACYLGASELAPPLAGDRPFDACEAAAMGSQGALETALARDPDAHAMYSGDGWTPLHLAGFFGRDECAETLLDAGASLAVMSRNSTANTPLHAALAGATNARLVERLLDAGADPNARGETGITPLHLAASRGDAALCSLLMARGADTGATMDDGTTPADMAEKRGHPALAAELKPS